MGSSSVQSMNNLGQWMYRTLLQKAFFCPTRPYLPDDDNLLWRMAGCKNTKQWDENKEQVLSMFIKLKRGGKALLKQTRLEIDWDREQKRRQVLAEKGRKGGQAAGARAQAVLKPTLEPQLQHRSSTELNGTELDFTEPNETELDGTNMSLKDKITDISRKTLHIRIPSDDKNWPEINKIGSTYGQDKVAEAFENWALTKEGEQITFPLGVFIRVVDGLIDGVFVSKANPEARALIYDLAKISNGTVLFDAKQSLAIGRLLSEYSAEDIKNAFRQFFQGRDEWQMKKAAKDFSEQADQLLFVQKDRREQDKREQQALAEENAKFRAEFEAELAEKKRLEAEDKAMIEDTLGG